MASEIRVNQIQNRSGLGTVTFSDAGLSVSGILTATTFSGNLTGNVTGTVSSSGIATFSNGIIVAAGTTAAPSISPSGDSNTGIFFPSADTIAFGEGGVEALRIDSSGRIGIGTNNIGSNTKLHIKNSAADDYVRVEHESNDTQLRIQVSSTQTRVQLSATYNSTGSYYPLAFLTSDTERARIDTSGRLLVGTNTARGNYLFGGSGAKTPFVQIATQESLFNNGLSLTNYYNGGGNPAIPSVFNLAYSRSDTLGNNGAVTNGDTVGCIQFMGNDGTNFISVARIDGVVDAAVSTSDMPGRLVFLTTSDGASTPTERLRITSDGYLNIAPNASSECRIQFDGTGARMSYNTATGHISFITNSAVRNLFLYNGQGTEFRSQTAIFPTTDNAVTCGTGGNRWSAVYAVNGTIQTSDSRQKCEIQESILGTEFIKSLNPVSYKWIEGGKSPIVKDVDESGNNIYETDEDGNWVYESKVGNRTHWGFLAQEVKEAVDAAGVDFGGWVLTDKDDPNSEQALRYDQFIAPLTKALQEAQERIETLEAQNAAQASALEALTARLDAAGL